MTDVRDNIVADSNDTFFILIIEKLTNLYANFRITLDYLFLIAKMVIYFWLFFKYIKVRKIDV